MHAWCEAGRFVTKIPRKMHRTCRFFSLPVALRSVVFSAIPMWWFTRRQNNEPIPEAVGSERLRRADHLLELAPDLRQRLAPADIALKIWLPEIVARTVHWLAARDGISQSEWLRQLLVSYLYGRAALEAERLREKEKLPAFSRAPVDRTKGRWVYLVPELGKNTIAFKLWISSPMRADLQALADHAGIPLSAFTREAIVADLMGRCTLPERPVMVGIASAAAQAWERDEEVPIVEREEHHGMGEFDQVWRAD